MHKFIGLFIIIVIVTIGCKDNQEEKNDYHTSYYLIRHAEKDRSNPKERNPHLTPAGKERSLKWATIFDTIPLDAIYSTDYNRTLETALPTAVKKEIEVQLYNPRSLYDDAFQKATANKNVLVVGHSNTTPAFANAILGSNRYQDIDDAENGMLFTVRLSERDTIVSLIKY